MPGSAPPTRGADAGATAAADCAVLTVTYGDRAELTINTLALAVGCGAREALVVTNGVAAHVREALQRGLEHIGVPAIMVELPENTGSAGGFGAGVAAFLERSERALVWILDDDNEPEPDALVHALAARRAAAEMAGCRPEEVSVACRRPSDAKHAAVAAGAPVERTYSVAGSFNHFDVRQRLLRRGGSPSPVADGAPVPVPSAPYGGLLTSRAVLESSGLPRSDFFLYEDDTEYTERFGAGPRAGRLVLALDAVVHDPDKEGAQAPEPAVPLVSAPPGEAADAPPRPVVAMLRTEEQHRMRLFYQTRNTVHLDVGRARSAAERAWLVVNAGAYLGVVTALALSDRRNRAAYPTFLDAVVAGLTGRMGRQARYHRA